MTLSLKRLRYAWLACLACAMTWPASEAAYFLGALWARPGPPEGSCAVLVLGFPSRPNGSISDEALDRVETAAEITALYGCSKIVLSGGAAHNSFVEAEVMSREALRLEIPKEALVLETRARNTVENAVYSAPFLTGFRTIYVVSNGLHAHRGVRDLCRASAELCPRARPAARHVLFRDFWLRPFAALHEARSWLLNP